MYSVYAGIGAGALFALILIVANRQRKSSAGVMTVLMSLALGGLLGAVVAMVGGMATKQYWEQYGTFPLASVDDRTSYQGTFVIGSGTFGASEEYRFRYWIRRRGGVATTVGTVPVHSSHIYEDATDSTAHLVQWRTVLKPPARRNWVFDMWTNWENGFHVPPGSVRNGYNIQ